MNPTSSPPSAEPPVIDVESVLVDDGASLDAQERADLLRARDLLQSPGVAIRFANVLGSPIEKGFKLLPAGAHRVVHRATQAALQRALGLALHSLDDPRATGAPPAAPDNRLHKFLVGASGAMGGAFGLGALVVELPVSTTLILRSIAQIAASQGHDLRGLETRLACLEVFALGGQTTTDNAAETSYWAVRAALAKVVSEAVASAASRRVLTESAPAAVRLITTIASRFGVVVSEQVAAKAVPILGAAAGAAINVVFMDHFQRMAEGHFILKRLEQRHGTRAIRRLYETLHARP